VVGAGDGDPVRLRRDALLLCRLSGTLPAAAAAAREGTGAGWLGRTGAGDEMPAIEVVETEPAVAVMLRALVLDEVRWWRGCG
jgi:hypothetical protein